MINDLITGFTEVLMTTDLAAVPQLRNLLDLPERDCGTAEAVADMQKANNPVRTRWSPRPSRDGATGFRLRLTEPSGDILVRSFNSVSPPGHFQHLVFPNRHLTSPHLQSIVRILRVFGLRCSARGLSTERQPCPV